MARTRRRPARSAGKHQGGHQATVPARTRYEAEVLPGLAPSAREELSKLARVQVDPPHSDESKTDAVGFTLPAESLIPTNLRTVRSLNVVLMFSVPRPKALLGDEHLRRIVTALQEVTQRAAMRTPETAARSPIFHALRLEAAGRSTPVMQRLADAFASAVGLRVDGDEGDLLVRIRPSPAGQGEGWQVLIRTTPRPLSARAWRVRNLPGGLNACVAAAVWQELGAEPGQRVANLMCGSGTLMIERAVLGPVAVLVGVDHDKEALSASRENMLAAGVKAELLQADATRTPFGDASFDVIVCDPPWGDAHGEASGMPALYEALLREVDRLLAPSGDLVVIVHALRAFGHAHEAAASDWEEVSMMRVFHGGHWPAVVHLRKAGASEAALLDSEA